VYKAEKRNRIKPSLAVKDNKGRRVRQDLRENLGRGDQRGLRDRPAVKC